MLQLHNDTPFRVALAAFPDRDGIDALFVVVKGTFAIGARLELADEQREIVASDRYRGEAVSSSLLEAGEHHVGKTGTDVVLQGHAYAPGGRPVDRSAVSVAVAERRKVVAVFGDRQLRRDRIGKPVPFERMPLVYERAYGGRSRRDTAASQRATARNPVGVGVSLEDGATLPNLCDPHQAIDALPIDAPPACFGPIAPTWSPRREHAGTYDAAWIRRRAPLLPTDFDPRFFQVAAPELAFDRPLAGGEPIEVIGASVRGVLRFAVPDTTLRVTARIGHDRCRPDTTLETIVLLPDEDRVTMTWRAKVPADRRLLQVERVDVALGRSGVAA